MVQATYGESRKKRGAIGERHSIKRFSQTHPPPVKPVAKGGGFEAHEKRDLESTSDRRVERS
jgi:hypothetical protein